MKKVTFLFIAAAITAGCMGNEEDRAIRRHMHSLTKEQKACVERQDCKAERADGKRKYDCLKRAFRVCGSPMPGDRNPTVMGDKVEVPKGDTCD